MSQRSLENLNKQYVHRSIVYHGKNSMTDMNLMMIGSTPLSQLTPKETREEIAYADGDLDLSTVDGKVYFQKREITYTFVSVEDYDAALHNYPVVKNRAVTNTATDIYNWLYFQNESTVLYRHDMNDQVEPGSPLDDMIGTVEADELYDYAYDLYKFVKVGAPVVQISKAMFNDIWVEQIQITFKVDPYLQSFMGYRLDIATFVDRAMTSRNVQTAMYVYNNNQYWLNDQLLWTNDAAMMVQDQSQESSKHWHYGIKVPYAGPVGMCIASSAIMNGVPHPIETVEGLYFYDNNDPGVHTSHTFEHGVTDYGFGFKTPLIYDDGYKRIDLDVYFENEYTLENKPWIYIEWGVIRNYSLPNNDRSNYIMDAYVKEGRSQMYVNGVMKPYGEAFELPDVPINEIHIRNAYYDGLYKLRYDTTTRRV